MSWNRKPKGEQSSTKDQRYAGNDDVLYVRHVFFDESSPRFACRLTLAVFRAFQPSLAHHLVCPVGRSHCLSIGAPLMPDLPPQRFDTPHTHYGPSRGGRRTVKTTIRATHAAQEGPVGKAPACTAAKLNPRTQSWPRGRGSYLMRGLPLASSVRGTRMLL